MLPRCREVTGEEDHDENQDQGGYRSLCEMLQGSFLDTVRARTLADLETPHDFLNVLRVG